MDCEKLGTSLEDAKAAREELAKRLVLVFPILNPFCFSSTSTFTREERLGHLVGVEPEDLIAAVEELVSKAAHLRTEVRTQVFLVFSNLKSWQRKTLNTLQIGNGVSIVG